MTKEDLMRKIQACDFAMKEAELYLDCHPDSKQALDYFHKMHKEGDSYKLEYENRYGPITSADSSMSEWNWVMDKWPWHVNFEEDEK